MILFWLCHLSLSSLVQISLQSWSFISKYVCVAAASFIDQLRGKFDSMTLMVPFEEIGTCFTLPWHSEL